MPKLLFPGSFLFGRNEKCFIARANGNGCVIHLPKVRTIQNIIFFGCEIVFLRLGHFYFFVTEKRILAIGTFIRNFNIAFLIGRELIK